MAGLFTRLDVKSDRMVNLDALRALASFGVICLHSAHYLDVGPWFQEARIQGLLLLVDLFFAISGFVISDAYANRILIADGLKKFWIGRFAYLYPLHLVTLLGFVGLGVMGASHSNHPEFYDSGCIPANVILGQAWGFCNHLSFNGPAWSLSAEVAMYGLFPFIVMLLQRSRALVLGLCVASFLILFAVAGTGDNPWYFWMAPWGSLRALPSFLLGVSLWSCRAELSRLPASQTMFWLSIAAYGLGVAMDLDARILLFLICLIVMFGAAADQLRSRRPIVLRLAKLGSLTYSSYMVHFFVLVVGFSVIAQRFLHLSGLAIDLAVFLYLLAIFPIAYGVDRIFVEPARVYLNAALGGHRPKAVTSTPS